MRIRKEMTSELPVAFSHQRARKRKALTMGSKDSENKVLREKGMKYVGWTKTEEGKSVRGAERENRKLGTPCKESSRCRKISGKYGCSIVPNKDREVLFKKFWSDMSWDQRKVYIVSLVTLEKKKECTTEGKASRRSYTLHYSLRLCSGEKVSVCKVMFHSTFNLGDSQVQSWVKGAGEGGMCVSEANRKEASATKSASKHKVKTETKENKTKDSQNKILREKGMKYVGWTKTGEGKSVRGAERGDRKLSTPCKESSRCRKVSGKYGCSKISNEDRVVLFKKFWSDMSWDQRKVYVVSLVTLKKKKECTTEGKESRRSHTFHYSLRLCSGEKVSVCKVMFLSTFNLGDTQVQGWVKSAGEGGMCVSEANRKEVSKTKSASRHQGKTETRKDV